MTSTVAAANKFLAGDMRKPMMKARNTRKGSSFWKELEFGKTADDGLTFFFFDSQVWKVLNMDSSKPSLTSNDALHIGSPSSSSQSLNHAGPVDLFADGAGIRLTHIDADGAVLRPLIQRINESGVDHKEILRAVMRNIVELSTHWLGSYAVEVCILKATAAADRELLVYAFAALPDHELAELVQNEYGNYVVQKLMRSAKDDFSEQAGGLARRIEQLPKCVLEQTYAKKVVRAIGKMFARRGD